MSRSSTDHVISVIVPVYNAEDYIKICGKRILEQSIQNFELLIIDDGSVDRSLQICEEIASADGRVKVFHQENAGVSAARNTGLDNANGEFVAFIDSDDLIAPDYMEYLYNGMKQAGSLLSICGHVRIYNYNCKFPKIHEEFKSLSIQECAKRLLIGHFPISTCGCLFKKDRIGELRFPVGIRNNEDKLFLYEYFLKNEDGTVAFSNEKLYGYMVRDGSATRSSWNGSQDIITVADQIREVTADVHPEWRNLAKDASLKARFDVMNSIVLSDKSIHGELVFNKLRKEVLGFGFPKNGGKRLQVEYIAARLGTPIYHALTQTYYKLYSEQRRFLLNEKRTKQG